MSSHSITRRPGTESELRQIRGGAKADLIGSIGCLSLIFIPSSYFLALGLKLAVGWIFNDLRIYGFYAGLGVGLVIWLLILFWFLKDSRSYREERSKDESDGVVEDVQVETSYVVLLPPESDHAPNLCFDIGEGKILLLQGQWILDRGVYVGASTKATETDDWDDRVNGLEEPFGFPSSKFSFTRLPISGDVLSVQVSGAYLEPLEINDAKIRDLHRFQDSDFLVGSIDELAECIEAESRKRHKV